MQIKSIFLLILFILSGIFYYNFTDADPVITSVNVERIIDGDTIEIEGAVKVRLKGINTPEKGMMGSEKAVEFLTESVLDREVELISFGEDKYGRILGFLFLENKNINKEILEKGFASLYYYERDEFYKDMFSAEEFARLNKLGIWEESTDISCLELVELKTSEPEKLILKNDCNKDLEILIKDDATHIYREKISSNSIFEKSFSHIWNDAGDSLYVFDDKGLLIFYRY